MKKPRQYGNLRGKVIGKRQTRAVTRKGLLYRNILPRRWRLESGFNSPIKQTFDGI